MNKVEFLRTLNQELSSLEKNERKEILDFYEERFYSGVFYENKTEEQVVSELEEPWVIAQNVLGEYGVNPKYIKTHDEKYKGVSSSQVILLLIFDLLITSWLIITLFTVTISLFAVDLTYFATFTLLLGDYGNSGPTLFAFATAIYIFIFLFSLFLLDLSVTVTKSIIIWHLNVFKVKNRNIINKKLNKNSVNGWFKKHRKVNSFKKAAFLLALVLMLASGYQLTFGDDNIIEEYQNRSIETNVYTTDVTNDIASSESWSIISDFGMMDIDVVMVDGDVLSVTHKYYDDANFSITIDEESNTIMLSNNTNFSFITLDIIAMFFNNDDGLTIEIPRSLLIDTVDLNYDSGTVKVYNLVTEELNINGENGNININNVEVNKPIHIILSNGDINLTDIKGIVALEATTKNGNIKISNAEFNVIELSTENGNIVLNNLLSSQDGTTLIASTKRGNIDITNAYFKENYIETDLGNIDFYNDDLSFVIDILETRIALGTLSSNLD